MRSIILIVSIILAYFTTASNAYSSNDQVNKERFDSYDITLIDSDPYLEKLHAFRNSLGSISSSGELIPAFEGNNKPKRGRQCLWKICSWSLEKSKKKAAPSVVLLDN